MVAPIFLLLKRVSMTDIKLVIDRNTLSEYEKVYFAKHTKAKKKPIEQPYHPSINQWMIMKRPMMNSVKQKWKDFIVWFINKHGYSNLHIQECEMTFYTYYSTNRRHDVDNTTPKFILDGLSESGFIIDDDSKHLKKLTLQCGVDTHNPRTEIFIKIIRMEGKLHEE